MKESCEDGPGQGLHGPGGYERRSRVKMGKEGMIMVEENVRCVCAPTRRSWCCGKGCWQQ